MTLAGLLDAGAIGSRAAAALREACAASASGAVAAAAILETAVATIHEDQRDLGRLLEVWEIACAASGARVTNPGAREALEFAAVGQSRRAAAARRLLGA